jgi:hypothetical protein
MAIERLKYWHWCVIGVFVGAVVAGTKLLGGVSETPEDRRVRPHVFEQQVLAKYDPISRRPVIKIDRVVIHPPDPAGMPVPGERAITTEFATYDAWIQDQKDHTKMVRIPHVLVMQLQQGAKDKDKSVLGEVADMPPRQYLTKLLAKIPDLKADKNFKVAEPFTYRYAWIETPKGAMGVYCTAGFVLIGLLWPTLVNVLARKGYGRTDPSEFDLSRYKPSKPETAKVKAGVTEADMAELARIEAELEAKLKAGAVGATAAGSDADVATAAKPSVTVKVLAAGPLEAPKPETVKKSKPKGFGTDQGDYYPTEVHGKKKE